MLDDRKKKVLQAIVEEYINTAEPVSSNALISKYGLQCSSATIRNEMADLEKKGLLDKMHTSSGRVPSAKGYRYYVDELLKDDNISLEEVKYISDKLETKVNEIEDLTKKNNKALKLIFFIAIAFISSFLALYFKNPLWLFIILPVIPFMFIKESLIKEDKNSKFIKDILESLPELNIEETNILILKEILNKELAKIEILMQENNNEETENYNLELENNLKEFENENNALARLFDKLKVKNKEEYYEIKYNYDLLLKENEENYKKLIAEAKKSGFQSIDLLETDCIRILKELDDKGVNPNDYNEMEIKKIENDLKDLEAEINILKEVKNNI